VTTFAYDSQIQERYPAVAGGILTAHGLKNGPTPEPLREAFLAEQKTVLARINQTPLSEIESLSAWRRAFRAFGVDPTQYRCAAEALLRRLTKQGDLPLLNMLVDIGNLVSIRYALPIAVLDTRVLEGGISVRFATGTEHFAPLGSIGVENPEPGEVIFADETGRVIARRWCWRQSEDSAAKEDTTEAILTVEAQHPGGRSTVQHALDDLQSLLRTYAGGTYDSLILPHAD
jgi:DNA/RNA-binding domain of Phe-tRNA-synthetase-like protein